MEPGQTLSPIGFVFREELVQHPGKHRLGARSPQFVAIETTSLHRAGPVGGARGRVADAEDRPFTFGYVPSENTIRRHSRCEVHNAVPCNSLVRQKSGFWLAPQGEYFGARCRPPRCWRGLPSTPMRSREAQATDGYQPGSQRRLPGENEPKQAGLGLRKAHRDRGYRDARCRQPVSNSQTV